MGFIPPFSDYDYHNTPQKVEIVSNRLVTVDLEELEQKCLKWERMFNMACHDRDVWQQQCEALETVVQRQREKIRELLDYERPVVIDCRFTEEELAVPVGGIEHCDCFSTIPVSSETESETQGISEATRNEGSDSGEASDRRSTGRCSEGLTP